MSLSSGLVTITFSGATVTESTPKIVVNWAVVPRKGDHVYLRRAEEDGSNIVVDGPVERVIWTDEGVTIYARTIRVR